MKTRFLNYFISITLLTSVIYSCNMQNNSNPLLAEFNTPHQTAPFDKIKAEHFMPAFDAAIAEAKREIDIIASSKETPTFSNTIEAMEFSGKKLNLISAIFFNLESAHTSDMLQAISLEVSPKLTEYSNYISLNKDLYKKVKYVYDLCDRMALRPDQVKLLDETYKSFVRNGSALAENQKEKYSEITTKLSTLSLEYGQNLLAATNAYTLNITDENDLAGLPDYVVEMAAEDAKARNVEGWVFTLQAPSMVPFLKYSENRSLREKLWRAYNSRCFGTDNYNNEEIIKQITSLRLEKANMLGYKTHAEYVLDDNMAKNSVNVENFLNELIDKSLPFAKRDMQEVTEYAKSRGADFAIMPWDLSFYADKLKDEKYSINDELLKPYFELNGVRDGIFQLSEKLWGLKFVENKEITPYQEDVTCYEVYDSNDRYMAVLYMDFFPRSSKSGGAWMTSYSEQSIENGVEKRPHVSITCNFTKPTETTPSLLTFDEVTTFLHEFGHALHGIFSEGAYASLAGTNVARDFVELPSQIMENWATEKEFLSLFAKHYKTGEVIPDSLIEKIIMSKNFNSGYSSIRQLTFGINDMAWHTITSPIDSDIQSFERAAIAKTQLLPTDDSTCMSAGFAHIFAGGYSAGYYSYKWAEVLEADAFSLFKEKGIFNKEVAESFRDNILSKGSSEDPMNIYIKFRGRSPQIDALLNKLGMK